MGRLKNIRGIAVQISKHWGAPFGVALIILILFQYVFLSDKAPSRATLESYLKNNNLPVDTDSPNGYQQVYYIYDGVKVYLTSDSVNHIKPVSSGQFVSWFEIINGRRQLFLYDLLDKTKLQITFSWPSSNQQMDQNKIVWEGLIGNKTQIFFFDGEKIQRISNDYESQRPYIKDGEIVYAQTISRNKWRNMLYKTDSGETKIINEIDQKSHAYPHFVGDEIKTYIYD